jgi:hypothetical protein
VPFRPRMMRSACPGPWRLPCAGTVRRFRSCPEAQRDTLLESGLVRSCRGGRTPGTSVRPLASLLERAMGYPSRCTECCLIVRPFGAPGPPPRRWGGSGISGRAEPLPGAWLKPRAGRVIRAPGSSGADGRERGGWAIRGRKSPTANGHQPLACRRVRLPAQQGGC